MDTTFFKKTLIGIIIFLATWFVSVIFVFVAVIVISFALRNHPSMNLEMGWMALIILIPPVGGTILSIPLSIFIIRKTNKWIEARNKPSKSSSLVKE